MAKLKIPVRPTDATFDHTKPNVQGYVNVVDNLVLNEVNHFNFLLADEDERVDMLKAAVGKDENNRVCQVWHELGDSTLEEIDSTTCLIKTERDKKRKNSTSKKPSKFTLPFPPERPTDVNYLNKYAEVIVALYAAGEKEKAHKFMFGMMMLTRCR